MKKYLAAATAIGLAVGVMSTEALAVEEDLSGTVDFTEAAAVTVVNGLDWGSISFSGTADGNITLDVDGSVTAGSGYDASGSPLAGELTIDSAADVDVSCEQTATLSDGTNTMPVQNAQVSVGDTTSATACAGIGTTPVGYAIGDGDDNIYVGAEIDGSTPPAAAGTYDTDSAGGAPLTVEVVNQ